MTKILLCFAVIFSVNHCTNELPLSQLLNNTMTLRVLGTYESNDPYADSAVSLRADDAITTAGVTGSSPTIGASQLTQYVTQASTGLIYNASRLKYYIDIAEIRMAQGQGKNSSQSISDYWSQFAISRQLMCSDYSTAENKILTNCNDANGVDRLSQFFNGGFTYPAVDVKSGSWNHLGIYFRRFVTFPAAYFDGAGNYYGGSSTTAENAITAAFDNRTIYGIDMESYMQNAYNENNSQGRMFPLERKDLSLQVGEDHEPYVLEIRIFIKNLMMVHLRQVTGNASTASDSSNYSYVYVAPADWRVNHAFTDTNSGGTISGNASRQGEAMTMTARMYQPARVGSIQMSGTVGSGSDYFAVVTAGTTFPGQVQTTISADLTTYTAGTATLPLAATRGTNTTIKNLPPGSYDVYRTCDVKNCTAASYAGTCNSPQTGTDGYPESAKLCASNVTVTTGTTTAASIAACATCP